MDPRTILEAEYRLETELFRRSNQPLTRYIPCPKAERNQLSFHQNKAMFRIGTGGNQSGKSIMGAAEISWWLRGDHPYIDTPPQGARVFCVSASYRTIQEGIWRHLKPKEADDNFGTGFLTNEDITRMGPRIPGWDIPSFLEVRNKNGFISRIDFISAEGGESARKRLQSAAVHLFAIDEEIETYLWEEILMRILVLSGKVIVTATMVRSEEWLVELERRSIEGDPETFLVRLDTDANEHINRETLENVFSFLSPEEQEIRRRGRSRASHGLVYSEFSRANITPKFKIPDEWPKFCALDPGFRTFAGLWIAINPETQRAFAYREMYLKDTNLQEAVYFVKRSEGWPIEVENNQVIDLPGKPHEPMQFRLIDPSAFRHFTSGEVGIGITLAAKHNMPCLPSQNAVEAGIESVRYWITHLLIDGEPAFKVFDTLTNFLGERRSYKFIKNTAIKLGGSHDRPDKPLKRRDHLMDTWRYLALHMVGPAGSTNGGTNGATNESVIKGSIMSSMESRISQHIDAVIKRDQQRKKYASWI